MELGGLQRSAMSAISYLEKHCKNVLTRYTYEIRVFKKGGLTIKPWLMIAADDTECLVNTFRFEELASTSNATTLHGGSYGSAQAPFSASRA